MPRPFFAQVTLFFKQLIQPSKGSGGCKVKTSGFMALHNPVMSFLIKRRAPRVLNKKFITQIGNAGFIHNPNLDILQFSEILRD
jgi:hypothetical protein